jgi:hypothetical protein
MPFDMNDIMVGSMEVNHWDQTTFTVCIVGGNPSICSSSSIVANTAANGGMGPLI